jgi:DNA-binding MarR family transcriptional regulator
MKHSTGEPDYAALARFRHLIRRFLVFSETAARGAGLQPQHHQLLLAVKGLPKGLRPTILTLSERLQLKHHTVVGLIDRMVRRGLLSRGRDLNRADLREVLVRISAKGERALRALSLIHREELRRVGREILPALEKIVGGRRRV